MAGSLQIEEIMVIAVLHDYAARLRSYQLLGEVFNAPARVSDVSKEISQE